MLWLCLALISGAGKTAEANEPARTDLVGTRVVQKNREFKLGLRKGGADPAVPLGIWIVEKVHGPELWIRGEKLGITGRARADQVVAIERRHHLFLQPDSRPFRCSVALVIRAMFWRDKDNFDQAMADCNEAIRIDPQYCDAYASRAAAWLDDDEFDKAISDCDAAIKIDPLIFTSTSGGELLLDPSEPSILRSRT